MCIRIPRRVVAIIELLHTGETKKSGLIYLVFDILPERGHDNQDDK